MHMHVYYLKVPKKMLKWGLTRKCYGNGVFLMLLDFLNTLLKKFLWEIFFKHLKSNLFEYFETLFF